MGNFFHYGAEGVDDLMSETYQAPTQEGGKLTVTISTHGAFHEFLETEGTLSLGDGAQIRAELREGQTGSFSLSVKSLDEVFKTINFKEMKHDILLGAYLTVHENYEVPGAKWFKTQSHSLYRFVPALEQTRGTNVIQFEHTARNDINTKTLEIWSWNRNAPALGRPSNSAFQTYSYVGVGAGIDFWPQTGAHLQREEARIEITGGYHQHERIGELVVKGTVVVPRTWWLDEAALAVQLQRRFDNGSGHSLGHFQSIAAEIGRRIQQDFDGFLGSHCVRVASPKEAAIRINFRGTGPRAASTTVTMPNGLEGAIKRLCDRSSAYNEPTQSYAMSRLMQQFLRANRRSLTVSVNLAYLKGLPDLRQHFSDAAYYGRVRDELAKTLGHEIGHACGFIGHITPETFKEPQSPQDFERNNDLMQQGGYVNPGYVPGTNTRYKEQFHVSESAAFLKLMAGVDWSPGMVDQAITMITKGAGRRKHDLFSR